MLDISLFDPSRKISVFEDHVQVYHSSEALEYFNTSEKSDTLKNLIIPHDISIQFRYVVHRQNRGFFTPVICDIAVEYLEFNGPKDKTVENAIKTQAEPYVEGALFMNHVSPFIVEMLKGQEAGFNRKHVLEDIQKLVTGKDEIWYSDWQTPPATKQSQRIVVYDLEVTGSFLDPQIAIKHFIDAVLRKTNKNAITDVWLTAGYQQATK